MGDYLTRELRHLNLGLGFTDAWLMRDSSRGLVAAVNTGRRNC